MAFWLVWLSSLCSKNRNKLAFQHTVRSPRLVQQAGEGETNIMHFRTLDELGSLLSLGRLLILSYHFHIELRNCAYTQ
jgi:hypothetical protein